MWALAIEILKALLAGDFKCWLAEHRAKEANEAAEKDMSDSDAIAQRMLRDKYTRK